MSPASESSAPEWHDGFARHSRPEWTPSAFSFSGADRYSDYPTQDEDRTTQRSWLPFYVIGSVVSVAFLLTAYLISHRVEPEPTPGAQVVEGSVFVPKATSAAPGTKPHASPSAPPVAAELAPPPVASIAQAPVASAPAPAPAIANAPPQAVAKVSPRPAGTVLPPAPVQAPQPRTAQVPQPPRHALQSRTVTARAETAPPGVAAQKSSAKAAAIEHTDVARNLASARASLDKNNLGAARSAISSALAQQPRNGSALQMQAELTSREDHRDSLLGYARLCAREGKWVCAWHNAGNALTVDASSSEAREMLTRSIAAQGAGTARQVSSGPPGPPIDPN